MFYRSVTGKHRERRKGQCSDTVSDGGVCESITVLMMCREMVVERYLHASSRGHQRPCRGQILVSSIEFFCPAPRRPCQQLPPIRPQPPNEAAELTTP